MLLTLDIIREGAPVETIREEVNIDVDYLDNTEEDLIRAEWALRKLASALGVKIFRS